MQAATFSSLIETNLTAPPGSLPPATLISGHSEPPQEPEGPGQQKVDEMRFERKCPVRRDSAAVEFNYAGHFEAYYSCMTASFDFQFHNVSKPCASR